MQTIADWANPDRELYSCIVGWIAIAVTITARTKFKLMKVWFKEHPEEAKKR